jgi:thiol-disulfide isomerase/thioredoxin
MPRILLPAIGCLLLAVTLLPSLSLAGQSEGRVSPKLFSAMDISVDENRPKIDPVVLPDLTGHVMQSDRQQNKLVLVVFWAAWCGDCRREMPTLSELYKKFKDKGLQILAVDLMEPPNTVQQFKAQFAIEFPILLDLDGETGRRFSLHAIPTTFLLDGQGRLIGKTAGYHDWSSERATRLITALLTSDKSK